MFTNLHPFFYLCFTYLFFPQLMILLVTFLVTSLDLVLWKQRLKPGDETLSLFPIGLDEKLILKAKNECKYIYSAVK